MARVSRRITPRQRGGIAARPIKAEGIFEGSPSRKPNQNNAASAIKPTSGNAISQGRRPIGLAAPGGRASSTASTKMLNAISASTGSALTRICIFTRSAGLKSVR